MKKFVTREVFYQHHQSIREKLRKRLIKESHLLAPPILGQIAMKIEAANKLISACEKNKFKTYWIYVY